MTRTWNAGTIEWPSGSHQMWRVTPAMEAETQGSRGPNLHLARVISGAHISCKVRILDTLAAKALLR
jgi:hypothetical protein